MGQFHKAQANRVLVLHHFGPENFLFFGSGQSRPTSYMACHVATPHQQRHLGLYAGYADASKMPFLSFSTVLIPLNLHHNTTSIQTLFTTIFFFISVYLHVFSTLFFIDNTGLGTSHGNDSNCHGYWASSPPPLPCSDRQVQMTSPYMQPIHGCWTSDHLLVTIYSSISITR